MPTHQVLPLTGYIFEASYSTPVKQANNIWTVKYGPFRSLKSMSRHWTFNVLLRLVNLKVAFYKDFIN